MVRAWACLERRSCSAPSAERPGDLGGQQASAPRQFRRAPPESSSQAASHLGAGGRPGRSPFRTSLLGDADRGMYLSVAAYVGLLRAVNVGGTGHLPMKDLVVLAQELGLQQVKTYIASGNLIFASQLKERTLKSKLEQALAARLGKPVGVLIRSATELSAILSKNPFADRPANRVMVLFLDAAPDPKDLQGIACPDGEEIRLGSRELYLHYPSGLGRSKLKLPQLRVGTVRNINTITKLAALSGALTT